MYECGTKVTEYLFLFKCFCFIATHDYLFCPMCKQVFAGCEVRGQYMIILSALLCKQVSAGREVRGRETPELRQLCQASGRHQRRCLGHCGTGMYF